MMTTFLRGCRCALGSLLVLATPVLAQTPITTPDPGPSANQAASPPPPAPAITASPLIDPAATQSTYVPAGYTEVWSDEFNEKALDTSKWWTRIIYGDGWTDHLNDEKQRYRENNNHVMSGTDLQLTARKVKDNDPGGVNYESGMIRSKATFKYAYFEARIKVPGGKGAWPAFWMTSDADAQGHATWPPEMDPLEMALNLKDDRPNMLHIGSVVQKGKNGITPTEGKRIWAASPPMFKAGPGTEMYGYYYAPFNFPDDYHVFGLLWESDDTITFYVDGIKLMKGVYKWKVWDGSDAPYAHVLCNLAVGGKWAGRYGIDDTAFPQAMSVDYIRVYQKTGEKKMGQSLVGQSLYHPPTSPAAPLAR